MPTNHESIQNYLYEQVKNAILDFDAADTPEIYAVSLLVEADFNPREPKLILGYNTLSHFHETKQKYADEGEAKWQLTCWKHDHKTTLCENDTQIAEWACAVEKELSDDIQKPVVDRGDQQRRDLFERFHDMALSVVRQLHTDGVLEQKFGSDVPVIVCDSPPSNEPLEWTRLGNPDGQASEFELWKTSPSLRVTHERQEKLKKMLSDDWKDTCKDDMTPLEAYENMIDLLAFGYLSKSMSAKRLFERDNFDTNNPDNREQGRFLTDLTKKQREMIALMLLEEREGVIHDILAMLTWRIDSGLELLWNGEPMPVDISGMGLHGDYVGRRDGWKWPADEHGNAVKKEANQEETDINERYCGHGVTNLMQCLIRRFADFKPEHWKLVESCVDNSIRRCFDMFLLAYDSDINTMDAYLEEAKKRFS